MLTLKQTNFPSAIVLLLAGLLLGACGPASQAPALISADIVYHNGNVVTGEMGQQSAEAVAVRDGRIVYVGSDADAQSFTGEETRLVDLEGNTMLPGLYDNHVHADIGRGALMEWEGGLISEVPAWVREARTIAELQAALSREADRVGPGEASLTRYYRPVRILMWVRPVIPCC
jgi:predicted amidohydrolase YtcJ